jgi:hypothetical protein
MASLFTAHARKSRLRAIGQSAARKTQNELRESKEPAAPFHDKEYQVIIIPFNSVADT